MQASPGRAYGARNDMYSKCVLVTGGVGFVGSHIAEALLTEGREVVVYDIFNSETTKSTEKQKNAALLQRTADEFESNGAKLSIINGDIRDQEKLIEVINSKGVTGCIHVGGLVDDRRSVLCPGEYVDVNIFGTCQLLDALGKCGVKMVVQASTRSVFGQRSDNNVELDENAARRPINPYGVSKVAADAMAHCYSHLHDMNVTLVRIFATYGPRGRPDMMPRILIESLSLTTRQFASLVMAPRHARGSTSPTLSTRSCSHSRSHAAASKSSTQAL